MTKEHDPCTSPHVDFEKVATRLSRQKSQCLYHFGSHTVRYKNRRGGLSIKTQQARYLEVTRKDLTSLECDLLIWSDNNKVGLTRFGREIQAVLRNREAALREASQHMEAAE
jgi:hypothetical protein